MAVKISAREEKAANKEAEAVLASLSRVGEAAVAQTLDDIREILEKDVPSMYHIKPLLQNPERTGVEGHHQWHRGSGSQRRQAWKRVALARWHQEVRPS